MIREAFFNDKFTNGIIGPNVKMPGPVKNGGHIIFVTTPGLLGADDNSYS